jgi:hypothetical protein
VAGWKRSFTLSDDSRTTAGIFLLAVVAVEYGGTFMLRIVRGRVPMTPFQQSFSRAGHAHAGVLVILAPVCLILADAAHVSGLQATLARSGVAFAAILMPAGFFLSSMGRGRTEPNRFIGLLWLGAAVLAAGVVSLGIGLLQA